MKQLAFAILIGSLFAATDGVAVDYVCKTRDADMDAIFISRCPDVERGSTYSGTWTTDLCASALFELGIRYFDSAIVKREAEQVLRTTLRQRERTWTGETATPVPTATTTPTATPTPTPTRAPR